MSDCFRSCHEGRATRTTTEADRAGWRATERTDRVEESQKIRVSEDIRADCDGSATVGSLANMHLVVVLMTDCVLSLRGAMRKPVILT